MDVAVLGMGRMGRAVAGRLVVGRHDVVVWNRSPGRAAEVVAAGAREVETIAEAVADRDVVITSLANDDAVAEVALGEAGIRPHLRPGAIYADSSTISPKLAGELADAFPRFVGLPILGSPVHVAEGRAAYMAGGNEVDCGALRPLLASLSERIVYFDRAPLAMTAKLANNLLLLAGLAALAEALTVGRAGGLSDDEIRALFANTPMVAPGWQNRIEGVVTGHQDPWWTTVLGAKDARLAVDVARDGGIDLPLARVVGDLYAEAAAAGWDEEDIIAVVHRYQGNHFRGNHE